MMGTERTEINLGIGAELGGNTQAPAPAPPRLGVPRKITIEPALNGFRVKVGCQELVFETRSKLLQELGRYLEVPLEVEREYLARAIHKELHGACPMPPDNATCASEQELRPPTARR